MTAAQEAIEAARAEVKRLQKSLRKGHSKQVSTDDDQSVIKATALTWFTKHRTAVIEHLDSGLVASVDDEYRSLLTASDKATTRARHLANLKRINKSLAKLQSDHVVVLSAAPAQRANTSDAPPQFSRLVSDAAMQQILANRWQECIKCVDAGAPLAATVMMGGLLEALLLAKVNQLTDKKPVINAKAAPKDHKTGKTLNLSQWGLKDFISVAYELQWITPTTKDVGNVVREYRNYVHPQKEHSHGVSISPDDASMLWEIAKRVARQVLGPSGD